MAFVTLVLTVLLVKAEVQCRRNAVKENPNTDCTMYISSILKLNSMTIYELDFMYIQWLKE